MVKSSIRPGPVATLLSGVALTCLAGAVLSPGVAAAAPMPVQPVAAVSALPVSGHGGDDDDFSIECSAGDCDLKDGPRGFSGFGGGGDVNIEHADKVNIDNANIDTEPEDSPGFFGGLFKGLSNLFGGGGSSSFDDERDHGDKGDRHDHGDSGLSKHDVKELLEEQQDQQQEQQEEMLKAMAQMQGAQGQGGGGGEAAPTSGPGGGGQVDAEGIQKLVEGFVQDLLKLLGVG